MENAAFVTEPTAEQITPERLRQFAYDCGFGPGKRFNTVNAAADRIEALEATNAKLLAALAYYADPSDYKLPFVGGKLFFDCGRIAAAAIAAAKGGGE